MNLTVRDKLKDLNVRLVEIASYLSLSRPTIYKYLEYYEAKEYSKIDKVTYDLFHFIDTEESLSRPALMQYLISHFAPQTEGRLLSQENKLVNHIERLIQSTNDDDLQLIQAIEGILFSDKEDQRKIIKYIKTTFKNKK